MENFHLLLVDDEERFLSTMKILLEKRGVSVLTAVNGQEAQKILKEKHVDVVVLDVKMPGEDGVEVLRRIKSEYPLIEVIMLTGHASVESAVEGLNLGAFDYLMKPCNVTDLLSKAEEAYAIKSIRSRKVQKPG